MERIVYQELDGGSLIFSPPILRLPP
jgi:hypothetical protein